MGKTALFVVCSCLLLFKERSASAVCPFVMTPSRVMVHYGANLTVNCSSTTNQIEGMGWESNYKGTGLVNTNLVQLYIEKVDRWDIESQCYMNFKNSTQCIGSVLPIIVYKNPDSLSIVSENKPMEEHKEYEMRCDVSNVGPVNKVMVTWYKGDTPIKQEKLNYTSSPPPFNQSQSSVLKIKADRHDHGNKLTCEVKFDFGPTWSKPPPPVKSPSLDLQVLYKPIFKEPKVEKVEVPANGKITLDCTAQGNPKPNYQWQVPTEEKVPRLPVLDPKVAFPGTYNCTASNSQGSSVKQFVVTDAPRDYTMLAAMVGVPAALGVSLLISGLFIVTKDGTFALNKGGYSKGQPSQPI